MYFRSMLTHSFYQLGCVTTSRGNGVYENQGRLEEFPVFTEAGAEDFAAVYLGVDSTQDRLYTTLAPR